MKARARDAGRAAEDMMTIIQMMETAADAMRCRGATCRFDCSGGTVWMAVDITGVLGRLGVEWDDEDIDPFVIEDEQLQVPHGVSEGGENEP